VILTRTVNGNLQERFYKTTPVEFTPDKAGEFIFACGMNMVRGKLIVTPA
jgi:plastocyanin domain-containing protein